MVQTMVCALFTLWSEPISHSGLRIAIIPVDKKPAAF